MASLEVTGAVLAGGRSSRMGTDKARLTVNGETLLARQLRLLAEAGVSHRLVSVAATPPFALPKEVRWVADSAEGLGPLAGLASCLAASPTDLLLVLAVDLPAVNVDLLRRLLAAARPGCGVMPLRREQAEPLVAIYPRRALPEVTDRLMRRELALQPIARAGLAAGWLKPWPISAVDEPCFTNWNQPGDLQTSGLSG